MTLHKLTCRPGENWFMVGDTGIGLRQRARKQWRIVSLTLDRRDPQWHDRNSDLFSMTFPRRSDARAHLEAILACDPLRVEPPEQRVRINRIGPGQYRLETPDLVGRITRDSSYSEGWALRVEARDRSWGPRTLRFVSLAHARSWADKMQDYAGSLG